MRKKGKRAKPLWKKRGEKANLEAVNSNVEILKRSGVKTKNNWVEKIYKGRNK